MVEHEKLTTYIEFDGEKLYLDTSSQVKKLPDMNHFIELIRSGEPTRMNLDSWEDFRLFSSLSNPVQNSFVFHLADIVERLEHKEFSFAQYNTKPFLLYSKKMMVLHEDPYFASNNLVEQPVTFIEELKKGDSVSFKKEQWRDFMAGDHVQSWMIDEVDDDLIKYLDGKINSLESKSESFYTPST